MNKIEIKEKRTKCLVTGAAGFIGSHVTELLLECGYEVLGLDNLSTGKYENLPENSNFTFINGDIRDLSLFNLIGETEYVFHLAALPRIQPSIKDPVTSHFVNLTGTLNVLEYCRKHKAKLIFSSSSSIYRGILLPTAENDPKDPKNPYSMQKLMAEHYIKLYSELYNLNFTILRYFNVYGERQILDGAYSTVIGILLNAKKAGKKLPVTGNGKQRRDFTYVKDVAKANVMAMNWRGAFNIGTGINYSINELAGMIGGEIEYLPYRSAEVMQTRANNQKAIDLGWSPKTSLEDWIKQQ